jgi:hypothetical protein
LKPSTRTLVLARLGRAVSDDWPPAQTARPMHPGPP